MAKNQTKKVEGKKTRTYQLTYWELLTTTIEVEATSAAEAREKAWDGHPGNIDFASMTMDQNGFKNIRKVK